MWIWDSWTSLPCSEVWRLRAPYSVHLTIQHRPSLTSNCKLPLQDVCLAFRPTGGHDKSKIFCNLKYNESNAVEAWVEMEGRRSGGIYQRWTILTEQYRRVSTNFGGLWIKLICWWNHGVGSPTRFRLTPDHQELEIQGLSSCLADDENRI